MVDLIVINVYGDKKRAQRAWKLIGATFRRRGFHADAVLVDGPVYVKSQGDYVEVTIRDNRG